MRPELWKDDAVLGVEQVVFPCIDVVTDYIDMTELSLNQLLHLLRHCLSADATLPISEVMATYRPLANSFVWEPVLPPDGVQEVDAVFVRRMVGVGLDLRFGLRVSISAGSRRSIAVAGVACLHHIHLAVLWPGMSRGKKDAMLIPAKSKWKCLCGGSSSGLGAALPSLSRQPVCSTRLAANRAGCQTNRGGLPGVHLESYSATQKAKEVK